MNNSAKADLLRQQVADRYPQGLAGVTPDAYVAAFEPGNAGYQVVSQAMRELELRIQALDSAGRAQFNRYLVACLLQAFDPCQSSLQLPVSITTLYERDIARIAGQLEISADDFYDLGNDVLIKDLAILTCRLIPIGAEYVCLSGMPRSLLLRGGPAQWFKGVWAVLLSGGFSPFLELHAHPLALQDFNAEGWQASYLRIAALLDVNPALRGLIGSSWFVDPALESISPHLNYLRDVPARGGAVFLFSARDDRGTSGALATSATRKSLFERGDYVPRIYTRVWPRRRLLRWRERAQLA